MIRFREILQNRLLELFVKIILVELNIVKIVIETKAMLNNSIMIPFACKLS